MKSKLAILSMSLIVVTIFMMTGCSLGTVALFDQDRDGVPTGQDCDDANPEIGVRYLDQDGDGFALNDADPLGACDSPNAATVRGDCHDGDANIFPGQIESCNDADDDCDGPIDEGMTYYTYFTDNDHDGYGHSDTEQTACTIPPGVSAQGGDCDDSEATVYPGAQEKCDGVDNDCDAQIDENLLTHTYAPDTDFDGYGDASFGASIENCQAPSGYVQGATDCDDGESTINPGASEFCDGVDEDCDGNIDESPIDGVEAYLDEDGDGYGVAEGGGFSCEPPNGYASVSGDCNDSNPAVHPGSTEVCNGFDDDCDGFVDDNGGSGSLDCNQAILLIVTKGFVDEGQSGTGCSGSSYLASEIDHIDDYLSELGFELVVIEDTGLGLEVEALSGYPLVIYDNGGRSVAPPITTVNSLIQSRNNGTALFFIGDDLGAEASEYDEAFQDRRFFELLYFSSYTNNGCCAKGVNIGSTAHPILDGPFGSVGDFNYEKDLDIVIGAGRGETILGAVDGLINPAFLAAEEAGQRTVVMLPNLYSTTNLCPVSDADGISQLKSAFQNGIIWALGGD